MRPQCDKDSTIAGCSELIVGVALGLLVCLIISLCSCKPQKEVVTEYVEQPVVVTQEHHTENVRVDIVRDTILQRDSIIYRDSIYHFVKGDTVIIERWHYSTDNHHYYNNNVATKVDTLVRVDSVQVPVETIKTKEVTKIEEVNRLKWWQKTLQIAGGVALLAFAFWLVWKIRRKAT